MHGRHALAAHPEAVRLLDDTPFAGGTLDAEAEAQAAACAAAAVLGPLPLNKRAQGDGSDLQHLNDTQPGAP